MPHCWIIIELNRSFAWCRKDKIMATSKSKKRDNNEGSIRRRSDGRWEGRFIVDHEADGTPIRRSIYAASRKELNERLKEAVQAVAMDPQEQRLQ